MRCAGGTVAVAALSVVRRRRIRRCCRFGFSFWFGRRGRFGVRFGRGESGIWEEDSDGERGEGIDVDVFGGDAVGEGRVRCGDGFVGPGSYAKRVGSFGSGLDPAL